MKKKAITKIASALVLTLAFAAASFEWNGYQPFDRDDGSNALCDWDKDCRGLTEGEIALAQSVFGATIDYSKVKIFSRGYYGLWPVSKNTIAISPNGSIYFPKELMNSPDFSKEGSWKQEVFLHEMTHVWQYQNGTNVRLAASVEFFKSGFDYNKVYRYDPASSFDTLNLEQQARMVEDYFNARAAYKTKSCASHGAVTTVDCQKARADLKELTRKLESYLPLPETPAEKPLKFAPPVVRFGFG